MQRALDTLDALGFRLASLLHTALYLLFVTPLVLLGAGERYAFSAAK